jgi:hypothetical protein
MQINHTKPQWLALFVCLLLLPMPSASHLNELEAPDFPILDVEWHPNGNAYAVVDDHGNVIVLNSGDATKHFQFDGTDEMLFMAAVSWNSDGTLLAAGIGHQVYIWETSFWKLKAQFTAGNSDGRAYSEFLGELPEGVTTLSWRADSQFLAAASVSSITTVWDDQNKTILYQEFDGSGGLLGRLWLNNEILTDGITNLNPFSGEETRNNPFLFESIGSPSAIDVSYEKHLLVRGDEWGNVYITDLIVSTAFSLEIAPPNPTIRAIQAVSLQRSGKRVAAITRDGEISIINLATKQVEIAVMTNSQLAAVDWNPQTNEIIYAGVSEDETPILSIIDVAGIAGVPAVIPERGIGE